MIDEAEILLNFAYESLKYGDEAAALDAATELEMLGHAKDAEQIRYDVSRAGD